VGLIITMSVNKDYTIYLLKQLIEAVKDSKDVLSVRFYSSRDVYTTFGENMPGPEKDILLDIELIVDESNNKVGKLK
jgi:hypothetical protein